LGEYSPRVQAGSGGAVAEKCEHDGSDRGEG